MKSMFRYMLENSNIDINHRGISWITLLCNYALEPLGESIE